MVYFWLMGDDNLMDNKIRLSGENVHIDICTGGNHANIYVISADQTSGYV